MIKKRLAFTLIEVLASVLILTLGLTSACALILYGFHHVRSAHGRSIGMATAMTVLIDSTPLRTDPTLTPAGPTSSGYLNGLWVVRSESDGVFIAIGLIAVTVTVDVFETTNGECFASTTRRLIRRIVP